MNHHFFFNFHVFLKQRKPHIKSKLFEIKSKPYETIDGYQNIF